MIHLAGGSGTQPRRLIHGMLISATFLATVFLYSLGQLGRISFLNQQINFYVYEVFLIISLSILLIKYSRAPLKKFLLKNKILLLLLYTFLFSYFLSIFNYPLQQNLVALLYLLRLITYLIYFFYLYLHYLKEKKFHSIMKFGFYYLLFSTLLVGIVQYFLYPNLRNLKYLGWDEHLYRMFGQFFDTTIAGAIYGLLFLAVFLQKKKNSLKVILLLLLLAALLLSFSRLTFIAFLTTALVYFFKNQRIKYFGLLIIFFVLLIFLLPKPAGEGVNLLRTASLESRVVDYQEGIGYWSKAPLFGYGYNQIRSLKNQSEVNLHSGAGFSSSFLIILVCTGIVGLILFLKLLLDLGKINIFANYAIIFLSVLSLGDNVLLHPLIIFTTGLLIVFFVDHG